MRRDRPPGVFNQKHLTVKGADLPETLEMIICVFAQDAVESVSGLNQGVNTP